MSQPSLSVALPVFNGANYLPEALDSVLAQEFGDFELVVSDNGSTDDTPGILAEYSARDRRIRVSRLPETIPQAANVNRAIELCQRDWVKLLCHDDLMLPECLGTIQRAIQELSTESTGLLGNGEAWLFTNGYQQPAGPEPIGRASRLPGQAVVRDLVLGRGHVPLPSLTTATVRKAAWHSLGGFDARYLHFDTFFWLELLLAWDYIWLPNRLTINRIHPAQVAVSARKSLRSVEDHRRFWPGFAGRHGSALGLSRTGRAVLRLRPIGSAASIIAIELLKGNLDAAGRIVLRTPVAWWPALPLLVARSVRSERRKLRDLRGHVPLELIYP